MTGGLGDKPFTDEQLNAIHKEGLNPFEEEQVARVHGPRLTIDELRAFILDPANWYTRECRGVLALFAELAASQAENRRLTAAITRSPWDSDEDWVKWLAKYGLKPL